MTRPVASNHVVTLGYREKARFNPNYIHRGIDYGCPTGTPVRATVRGKVVHAGRGGMGSAFGIHVVLLTDGIYHIYAHLSAESVKVGQLVEAGQRLGTSGATGTVTGAHLHYGEFTSYHYKSDRRPLFDRYVKPSSGPAKGSAVTTVATINTAAEAKAWMRSTFDARMRALRENLEVDKFLPQVVAVQESGGRTYLAKLDKVMVALGYRRAPGGGRWRYIYYRPNHLTVRRSGLITLNKLGTKHAAWAELVDRETKRRVIVTSLHLSEGWSSSDSIRIGQAATLVRKIAALNTGKVPMVHAGDFNSYGLVIDKVLEPAGFSDSLDIADTRINASADSFNGRTTVAVPKRTPSHGRHLDHVAVSKGVYVSQWRQLVDAEVGDHNRITVRLYY